MRLLLFALALAGSCAAAQPLALPAPPQASLEQRIGAQVPLDAIAADEAGVRTPLARYVDGTRPVLLVPGYYRCAQLCGLVMHDLVTALQATGVPASHWRIVGISIDPREGPADARARREAFAYARGADLNLLTLAPPDLQRVTAALGVKAEVANDVAHPATVVLLTPQGRIARYLNGLGIEGGDLRVALADAAGDRLGAASARIALLCAHFDPRVGRLDAPVMNAIRAMAALLVVALASWCWRRRGSRGEGR